MRMRMTVREVNGKFYATSKNPASMGDQIYLGGEVYLIEETGPIEIISELPTWDENGDLVFESSPNVMTETVEEERVELTPDDIEQDGLTDGMEIEVFHTTLSDDSIHFPRRDGKVIYQVVEAEFTMDRLVEMVEWYQERLNETHPSFVSFKQWVWRNQRD
jgi:hypothetical protein